MSIYKISYPFILLFILINTFTYSDEFYVSANGSDNTGNGSMGNPWRTVAYAVQSISPSAVNTAFINITAGTFTGSVSMKDYITLEGGWDLAFSQNNPALNVTVLRPQTTSQNLILCSGTNTFSGLTLSNASTAIQATSGNIIITSCIIKDNLNRGVSVEGNVKLTVNGCSFISNPVGIYSYLATEVSITQNNFNKNTDKAIYVTFYSTPIIDKNIFDSNKTCVYISRDNSGGAIIKRNIFYKSTFHGIYLYRSASRVENNVFILNESGLYCDSYSPAKIYNNTFNSNRADGISLTSTGSDIKIINNIIVNSSKYGIAEYDVSCDPHLRNNCIFSNISGSYLDEGTTPVLLINSGNIQNGTSPVENNISKDPIFQNDFQYDFHIAYGSPCIDAGNPSDAPTTDFDGKTRPNDIPDIDNNGGLAQTDIGCDEYYWDLSKKILSDHILGKRDIIPSYFYQADKNEDGIINISDLILFINHF